MIISISYIELTLLYERMKVHPKQLDEHHYQYSLNCGIQHADRAK